MGLWNSDRAGRLSDQISALQDELRGLRKQAAKRGSSAYDTAQESASEIADLVGEALGSMRHVMGRRANQAGGVMRAHPTSTAATAAVVGLVVAGLAARMFMNRGSGDTSSSRPAKASSGSPARRTRAATQRKSAPRKTTARKSKAASDESTSAS